MEYKPLDQLTEDELVESFDIKFNSVFELEQELRYYARREAEILRKAVNATKKLNKMLGSLKVTEAQLIETIKERSRGEGKPIAPSAFGEIRKSMVAKESAWQDANLAVTKAQAESDLWNGLLAAWKSRGFRFQELAKIAERTMFGEFTISEKSNDFKDLGRNEYYGKYRSEEHKIESKMDAQNKLEF